MTTNLKAGQPDTGVVARICHKEQMGIWANEIATAISLSDFPKEDWSFDDSVDLEKEIEAQLRDIIRSALTHPEFNFVERLAALQSQLDTVTREREEARAAVVAAQYEHGEEGLMREAAERERDAMREALKRQKQNIEHWLETGEAAGPEESKSIYDQICKALQPEAGK